MHASMQNAGQLVFRSGKHCTKPTVLIVVQIISAEPEDVPVRLTFEALAH